MGSMFHGLGALFGAISEATMVESSCEQCKLLVIAGEVPIKVGETTCEVSVDM